MSLLLALPAVGVVLFLGRGFGGALRAAWLMAQVQIVIGVPFFSHNAAGYLGRAFELSRQFFFKWTVNWRFVGEETFLGKPFSIALLALHLSVLLLFAVTRWLNPAQRPLSSLVPAMLRGKSPFSALEEAQVAGRVTPRYVLTTILSANVMGLLFARSLHYQFYAYLAWSTPYLLWRSGLPVYVVYILWAAQEWAWNVYPSTDLSSEFVVGVMAVTVAATWFGTADEGVPAEKPASKKK
ncbi:dolichyl-P-Man:Man(5)GlcNAc(2)-PP-dolichyl mannosyltransferase [Colletotrichum higginsianum]|nr:dolichyl-P-Man:Man(5)GlcNAc(2)-PP-dolichyl mannosyltransferase [Colletotrichum higginsianum]